MNKNPKRTMSNELLEELLKKIGEEFYAMEQEKAASRLTHVANDLMWALRFLFDEIKKLY